jgi:hypothetical protein
MWLPDALIRLLIKISVHILKFQVQNSKSKIQSKKSYLDHSFFGYENYRPELKFCIFFEKALWDLEFETWNLRLTI